MDLKCAKIQSCYGAKFTGNSGPLTAVGSGDGSFRNTIITVPQVTAIVLTGSKTKAFMGSKLHGATSTSFTATCNANNCAQSAEWNVGTGANVLSFSGSYSGYTMKVNAATTVKFTLVCSGTHACASSDFQVGSGASTSYAVALTANGGEQSFYKGTFNAPRATNMPVKCESNNACQNAIITGNTGPVTLATGTYNYAFYQAQLTVAKATSMHLACGGTQSCYSAQFKGVERSCVPFHARYYNERHQGRFLWRDRCGSLKSTTCESKTEWPNGSGGRCSWSDQPYGPPTVSRRRGGGRLLAGEQDEETDNDDLEKPQEAEEHDLEKPNGAQLQE